MIIKIEFKGGEGTDRREFTVDAFHLPDMDAPTLAAMMTSIVETLSRHPEDVWHLFPRMIPELEEAHRKETLPARSA